MTKEELEQRFEQFDKEHPNDPFVESAEDAAHRRRAQEAYRNGPDTSIPGFGWLIDLVEGPE